MEGPSTFWLGSMLGSGAVCIVAPVVVVAVLCKRASLSWRIPLAGALVFFVSQVVVRIPLTTVVAANLQEALRSSTLLAWMWLVALSFSAGVFEDGGRWIGYRTLLRSSTWTVPVGVAYGLGHGGFEAMVLVGLTQVVTALQLWTLDPATSAVPDTVRQQWYAVATQPGWVPLLALWERASAMVVHVALSLTVLRGVLDRRFLWLLVAIACHGSVNFVAVGLLRSVPGPGNARLILVQTVVSVLAVILLRWALSLHRSRRPEPSM